MIVFARSSGGKTTFCCGLVSKHTELFAKPFNKIILVYSLYNDAYGQLAAQLPGILQLKNSFDLDELNQLNAQEQTLLILEDATGRWANNEKLAVWFSENRHANLSIILCVHDYYLRSENFRMMRKQANYWVFCHGADAQDALARISHKMYPEHKGFLPAAFNLMLDTEMFGHLLIDRTFTTPRQYRVRGNILDPEKTIVYTPK
jgi:hypothetical protein